MCTNPILIKNKKFRNLKDVNTGFIHVPCGVCDECLSKRANDLFLRAHYEYEDCLKNGGIGFMCCLTYSDDVVPTVNIDGVRTMVFNKKHCIDFVKRLRTSLDRHYLKYFKTLSPKFKYLITSEFGSDPGKTHRPHYHLLFFFKKQVSITLFRSCFQLALVNQKSKKRVFGRIFQCDVIDPKKGGIRYSAKYVLKDLMYEKQRDFITKRIKFKKDIINQRFGILPFPQNAQDEFHNRCIRSTKEYKQAVSRHVLPYRHMLQFYMLSNDLGISAIINKYGDHLSKMPVLSIEGLPYSLPFLVRKRVEETQGVEKRNAITRKVFLNFLRSALDCLVFQGKISNLECQDLYSFAENCVIPYQGKLKLVHPLGFDFLNCGLSSPLKDWDTIINEFNFYDDNNYFDLRARLLDCISLYNSVDSLNFRAKVAKKRKDAFEYENRKKKLNRINIL